jgi:hypothetical protein
VPEILVSSTYTKSSSKSVASLQGKPLHLDLDEGYNNRYALSHEIEQAVN